MTMPRAPGAPKHFYCPRDWTLEQRLEYYTDKDNASTSYRGSRCWLWAGKLDKAGYGMYTHNRVTYKAHRLVYETYVGAIPKGLLACHRCDVPSCVRPSHLFLGTYKDNADDRDRKGRGEPSIKRGSANGSSKLTEEQVIAIYTSTDRQVDLARRYGVKQAMISLIKRGQKWGWLTSSYTKGVYVPPWAR